MIKQFIHKALSILMAFFVLFSTTSFTVEKHYCGGNLIDVAIFSEADKCGGNMEMSSMKSCCKDEVEVIVGQDELNISSFDELDFDQKVFLVTFFQSYTNLYKSLPKQIIPFKDYSPPNLVYDIHILDQVYLI